MAKIKIDKVVSSLPVTLVADTIYVLRAGTGFDFYVSDSTGATAHKLNANCQSFEQTTNIVKNTDLAISATKKILSITVYNPSTGKLITPQPTLAANRLSGTIRLTQNITNAEITIITV